MGCGSRVGWRTQKAAPQWPVPAILGVILSHVLDEVSLLQALVSGGPGYVLGSAGEKQVTYSSRILSGPQGLRALRQQVGSLPLN